MTRFNKTLGKLSGYIINHPFYGGLLLLIIGAFFAPHTIKQHMLIALRFVWGKISSFWVWTTTHHSVYGWVLITLSALSVLSVYLLTSRAIKTYKLVKRENNLPDYLSYKSEELYGVVWEWTWEKHANGEFHPNKNLKAYCPRCSSQLNISTYRTLEIECVNNDCDWRWYSSNYTFNRRTGNHDTITYGDFHLKLTTEIDRKVRSEEYKTA